MPATVDPLVTATGAGLVYPCGLCNELDAQAPGDLCARCSMDGPIVCTRCGGVQQQYGPCIACETGR